MTKKKETCEVDHCDRDVGHPALGLCKPCYAALWYWQRLKSPGDLLERAKQLDILQARADLMLGNIKRTSRAKRKKRAA